MNLKTITSIFLGLITTIISCKQQPGNDKEIEQNQMEKTEEISDPEYDIHNPISMVKSIVAANGGRDKLRAKKDIAYDYVYHNPVKNLNDISSERYLISSEASYGKYSQHQINVLPDKQGEVVQIFDGQKASVYLNGKKLEDEQAIGSSEFLRRVNYFWLTMMFKIGDKGLIYKYLGQEKVKGTNYDKLQVTYDPKLTGKEQNDTYILFVNTQTKMVDRFLFSLPAFGYPDPVLLSVPEYEDFDGLKLPTTRRYYAPLEGGGHGEDVILIQTCKNIKFNNGFTVKDFRL